MSSPLTLENSLILACVSPQPDVQHIRELMDRRHEWQEVVRKADQWRVVQSVYLQLRQEEQAGRLPASVAHRLKHLYYRDTIRGIARRELVRAALLRFSEASVPVIVLKAAALAAVIYQSDKLRPTRRIELLIHRRDLARSEEVLRGLREKPAAPPERPEGNSLLDVRHHIFDQRGVEGMPAAAGIRIEDFWARARPVEIASVST